MSDLGVYIACLHEEYLITPCVQAIQKVFPQVEVIDLGSQDKTLKRLSKLDVVVHHEKEAITDFYGKRPSRNYSGDKYTELKNVYSRKHDWVFWVDGDEIWPEDNLRYLKANWETNKQKPSALRIAWRELVVVNNTVYASEPLSNGPKLFNTRCFWFIRPWPYEVLHGEPGSIRQSKEGRLQTQWCWHGRLLNRSSYSNAITDPVRYDKWRSNISVHFKKFHPKVVWERLDGFPWPSAPEELLSNKVEGSFLHDAQ